jgi:hypothetical protein
MLAHSKDSICGALICPGTRHEQELERTSGRVASGGALSGEPVAQQPCEAHVDAHARY